MMNITFSGTYSRADLLQSLKIHHNRSQVMIFVRAGVIVIVLIAYAVYLLAFRSNDLTRELGLLLPVVIILLLLGRPLILPYEAISKVMKDEDAGKPISGRATDECLVWNTSRSSAEIKWEVFKDVVIRDRLILLYQDGGWYTLMPRSFFENDRDWNSFLSFIRSKLRSA